jgi:hypothetical protein
MQVTAIRDTENHDWGNVHSLLSPNRSPVSSPLLFPYQIEKVQGLCRIFKANFDCFFKENIQGFV